MHYVFARERCLATVSPPHTPGFLGTHLWELPPPLSPGYIGRICNCPGRGVGGRYTVSLPGNGSHCRQASSGELNPPVQFYNPNGSPRSRPRRRRKHRKADAFANSTRTVNARSADASSPVVLDLSRGRHELRGAGGRPDQVMVRADPISAADGCSDPTNGGATDVFGVDGGGTWWIFDPTLALLDNASGRTRPGSDAATGGDGALPICAPPTFLNEGRCVYVGGTGGAADGDAAETTCAARGVVCPGDVGEVANDPFSEFSLSAVRDVGRDRVRVRTTTRIHLLRDVL